MVRPKITLYVDIVSPFAYLAYYTLRHSPVFKPCEITYVPILLGGLMKACDNRAPIEIRNKDKWIDIERRRWASQFNIPMVKEFPQGFPRPTLQIQRALVALELSHPHLLPQTLDALYASLWVDSNHTIHDVAGFRPVLESVLGPDVAADVVARMAAPETKKRLSANTDQALGEGAFGIPWFQCENAAGNVEGFWGFDHLGQVVRFLDLDGQGEIRPML